MRKIFLALFAILSFVIGGTTSFASEQKQQETIYYYWSKECPYCRQIEPMVEKLPSQYPQYKFEMREISEHPENVEMLKNSFQAFNVPTSDRGIPIAFFRGKVFVGVDDMQGKFIEELKRKDASEAKLNPTQPKPAPETPKENTSSILYLAIAVVGVIGLGIGFGLSNLKKKH